MDHVIDGLMWTFLLTIDRGIIATSVFDNNPIFKLDLDEARISVNISSFINAEDGAEVRTW